MFFLAVFILEIILLFLLSQALSKSISRIVYNFTRSQRVTIHFISFLFLPGVIVHELSHFLTASVLFVKVGEIEFMPKIQEGGVKLGSVSIAKTDPIRRAVIGVAPVICGLSLIFLSMYFLIFDELIVQSFRFIVVSGVPIGTYTIFLYILFVVSNTMFSSRKDLEGTLELIVTFIVILAILYFAKINLPLDFVKSLIFSERVVDFVKRMDLFLTLPIGINAIIILAARMISRNKF